MSLRKGRLPDIVVPLPQVAEPISTPVDFFSDAISLLTGGFRVAISGTIGFRPIDCAFRDRN